MMSGKKSCGNPEAAELILYAGLAEEQVQLDQPDDRVLLKEARRSHVTAMGRQEPRDVGAGSSSG